jgi:hypothetical protein
MVSVPSTFEKNASPVAGSNAAPSLPEPIGAVATTLPALMSETAMTPLRHPLNSRECARSIAIDTGCLHGKVDQRRVTVIALASISTTSLLSVMFT